MQIYNTMTRKKEELVPLVPGKISMYACGPTVYNYFHIGNARPFIVFDTLRRYLEYRGYEVAFVQNFTDIDDKMIRRANEEGTTVAELGERFIDEYYRDADALGVERATENPRATQHIDDIIHLVQTLIDKGHAYPADNGDVYFSVRSFPGYGKLSGQNIDDLENGARVDPTEQKRDPLDFALWKGEKPGEPSWDSPWGKGRPGWHIECSAMSMAIPLVLQQTQNADQLVKQLCRRIDRLSAARFGDERIAGTRKIEQYADGIGRIQIVVHRAFKPVAIVGERSDPRRVLRRSLAALRLGKPLARRAQPRQRGLRLSDQVAGEVDRVAIVYGQHEHAHGLEIELLRDVPHGEEVAERFAHLLIVHIDITVVHPVAGKRLAGRRL